MGFDAVSSLHRREAATETSAVSFRAKKKAVVYRERVVLGWLQRLTVPVTSAELAETYYWHAAISRFDKTGARLEVRRALSGLKSHKLARYVVGGVRKCSISGERCETWEAVPAA